MKKAGIIVLSLFIVLSLSGLVSAQYYGIDLRHGAEQITRWIQDIFGPFFEVLLLVSSPEFLFAKVLLAVLLFIVIYIVLDKSELFGDYKTLVILISVIISLIAVRYLPEETFIQFIILPYNVLGVALLTLLPLIIYFFFVENINDDIMRKIAWAFYAAIFFGLWMTRFNDLGDVAYIYLLAAVLAILFILFDKTIRYRVILRALDRGLDPDRVRSMVDLQKKIADDQDRLQYTTDSKQRKNLLKEIRKNQKSRQALAKM
jgi:hypothetical protein